MAMVFALSSPLPKVPLPCSSSFRSFDSLLPCPNFSSFQKARSFLRFHGKHRYLTATSFALFPLERPYLSIYTSDPLRIRSASVSRSLSGGEGGGGDGGSSSGETAEKPVAGDSEDATTLGSDVIVLRVGGMICGGCAASVKRILETLPQVHSATVNLEKQTAFIWAASEAKVAEDWQQELGEQLAKHLTTCGFESNLQESSQVNKEYDDANSKLSKLQSRTRISSLSEKLKYDFGSELFKIRSKDEKLHLHATTKKIDAKCKFLLHLK